MTHRKAQVRNAWLLPTPTRTYALTPEGRGPIIDSTPLAEQVARGWVGVTVVEGEKCRYFRPEDIEIEGH